MAIGAERYNRLYVEMGNVNRLLAWGRARVTEDWLAQVPERQRATSAPFVDARLFPEQSMLHLRTTVQITGGTA